MGIGNIGWTEFLVILALALIFFGPRRLPGIASTIGKSLREFQKALNEVKSEIAEAGREGDVRAGPLRDTRPLLTGTGQAATPGQPGSESIAPWKAAGRPEREATRAPGGAETNADAASESAPDGSVGRSSPDENDNSEFRGPSSGDP